MFRNTNELNDHPINHLYQTERTPRVPGRICCGCHRLFASVSIPDLCSNCGHTTCEACLEIEFVSRGHNLISHQNTNEAPSNLLGKVQSAHLEPNQARDVNGHNWQELREQMQHERDHEQGNQVEPHQEHPKEQHLPSISGRKKRKLNMTKCQRCRDDKKACIRQDSEKCNRCTEKGLLCSEGTRVIRPRKLPSKSLLPTHDEIPPPIDSDALKISFDQIVILVSYYQMMVMARTRLNDLFKNMGSFFAGFHFRGNENPASEFRIFVNAIYYQAILPCLAKLLTEKQSPETLPTRSSLISLIIAVFPNSLTDTCPLCGESNDEIPIDGLRDSMDSCRNFLFKEHLLKYHGDQLGEDKLEEEIQIYTTLSTEVPQKIGVALESLGLSKLAEQSRFFGLFHDDSLSWENWTTPKSYIGYFDCLGRTVLHRTLDGAFEDNQELLFVVEQDERFWNDIALCNSRDILGRTPLHILCQFSEFSLLIELIQKVLKAGASSGISTAYGTIPLHHAAANGSAQICKLLIEHGGKSYMEARDFSKRTALDYAVIGERQKTVDLLTDLYIKAGLEEEVAKAHRIAAAVKEGTYNLWKVYV